MEERRVDQVRLLRAIEEQNALLSQILAFLSPIKTFVESLRIVMQVASWLTIFGGGIFFIWQYIKTTVKP